MDKQLAVVFPPGEFLAEELEQRNWSQADFADILGRPTQFVSEIIAGKKEITRESAAQIGAALGTSAELWLNLQNAYLLSKQRKSNAAQTQLSEVRRRARHNELAPVSLLRKRGYLTGKTLDEEESELVELFELKSISDEPAFLAAARRTDQEVPLTPLQKGWIAVARKRARGLDAPLFDPAQAERIAATLSQTVASPAAFAELPQLLGNAGVRLVYVESFPNSKMDGATFLLDGDPNKPVIAISGRGRRLDKVLFTILHELAHLIRGDVTDGEILLAEDGHTLGDERAADELAGSWAVPGGLTEPPRPIRQQWVNAQAIRHGVNWVVIVGQLQKKELLDWKTQLVRGAPNVTEYLEKWVQPASAR